MSKRSVIKEHEFFVDKNNNVRIDIKVGDELVNVKNSYDPANKICGYDVSSKDDSSFKFFFYQERRWNDEQGAFEDVYRASYLIGAQIIKVRPKKGKERTIPVIIEPKFKNIDYSKMFMTCLQSGLESEEFSKLYGVDFDSKEDYIDAPSVASCLNPLLLAHFLSLVEKLIKGGLKKDYIYCSENLKKPKGQINIKQNDKKNIIPQRYDRVYCNYSVYSVDIPENRIIKRALIFAKKMLQLGGSTGEMKKMLNKALLVFEGVSDQIHISEIKQVKSNKLFREYPETVRLAKMILKKYGYSISNVKKTTKVPPFWIDMSGLFELYTLVVLKKKFGDSLLYQYDKGTKFAWRPDFLLKKGANNNSMILDSKYKIDLDEKLKDDEEEKIVRQLSGYSRETRIREIIGVDGENEVDCVLIYPINAGSLDDVDCLELTNEVLSQHKVEGLKRFYTIPLCVPVLNG